MIKKNVYNLESLYTVNRKVCVFQYKSIHGATFFFYVLKFKKCKIVQNDLSTICKTQSETRKH